MRAFSVDSSSAALRDHLVIRPPQIFQSDKCLFVKVLTGGSLKRISVPCGSKQNLWCSVPPRRHILRQRWIPTVLLDLVERSGKAKVAHLHHAIGVQQHVGWLKGNTETQVTTGLLGRTLAFLTGNKLGKLT